MATNPIINPTAAAVTAASLMPGQDYSNYERVTFTASNLAGAETVTVLVVTPDGFSVAATDCSGAATGLSATNPSRTFYGGVSYVFAKSITAGACGLYWSPVVGSYG